MTDRLTSTWLPRDLPVLIAAARRLEDGGGEAVPVFFIAADTDLPVDDVMVALVALNDVYLRCEIEETLGVAPPGDADVRGLTERGRRVTGLWPSSDGLDGFAELLKAAEDSTDDPEEKGALRRAAGALYGISRDVGTDVLSAFIRAQTGL